MDPKTYLGAALVLALAATSVGCRQRTEQTEGRMGAPPSSTEVAGTTRTTGAELDEQAKQEGDKQKDERSDKSETAIREAREEGMAAGKAECEQAYKAEQQKKADARAKAAKAKTAKTSKAGADKDESARTTAKDQNQAGETYEEEEWWMSTEPSGTTTTTGEEMEVPNPTPSEASQNQSTTLGNGQSGMYTGGQGTYGGKATWGTGGSK